MKLDLLDKMAMKISPRWGNSRIRQKMATSLFFHGLASSGYIVPGSGKRSMRGWSATANHVDRDVIPALSGSRAGARDLFMNTPIASGILRRVKTNVVGWGLTMQSQIDRGLLGLSDKQADAWERNVEREWRLWADSQECDSRRMLNFNSLQALALFSVLLSGDVFILLPFIRRDGSVYDLRVQMIEADFVSNPNNMIETSTLAGGVEVDDWGAPVAYHMRKIPKNYPVLSSSVGVVDFFGEWERIPAFGPRSGRRNVLHLMNSERPGQRRGLSFLTVVIEKLKNVSRLSESELTAAIVTSFFTVFVKSTLPGGNSLGDSLIAAEKVTNPDAVEADKNLYEMGSGNIVELADGETIETAAPKRPNAAFEPFFQAMVKEVGSSTEIPYEVVMLCFNSSYSSSRAALLEAWRFFRSLRHWLVGYFCNPVYVEWLSEAVVKGRVSAPGFFDDPIIKAAWCKAVWTGPGMGQINPETETAAALARIGGRLSTYEREFSELYGTDWESAARRMSREENLMTELGISVKDLKPEQTSSTNISETTTKQTEVNNQSEDEDDE